MTIRSPIVLISGKYQQLPIGDTLPANSVDSTAILASAVTDAKLRNSGALTVIGRSANSSGPPADIQAGSDGQVLIRSSSTLGFGTIVTASVGNSQITYAKIQNISNTSRVLGRITAGAGVIEELTGADIRTIADVVSGGVGDIWVEKTGDTMSGNLTISNTAPQILFTDTTASAKSLLIAVDANVAQFRENAAASGSLLNLDLTNNRIGFKTTAPALEFDHVTSDTPLVYSAASGGTASGVHRIKSTITDTSFTSPGRILCVEAIVNFSSDPGSKNLNALKADAVIPASNTQALTGFSLIGLNFSASHLGSGALATMFGMTGIILNSGGATVTNAYGLDGAILNTSGTLSNGYGCRIRNLANGGTTTNLYGVWVGDITAGTQTNTPYSFYASDANAWNYFGGNTGFGVTNPSVPVDVIGADNATAMQVKINAATASITASDTFVAFSSTSGVIGSIAGTGVSGTIAYNTFTGSHYSQSDEIDKFQEQGLSRRPAKRAVPIDSTGENYIMVDYIEETTVPVYRSSLTPGAVLISTNEMCEWPNEENYYLPKCNVCSEDASKAIYGVYGGHDVDGDIFVLGLGAGMILVSDVGGPIEVGDLLCSSEIPGHARRYDGNDLRVVIAKARENFSTGTGLIACTLLCG